MCFSILMVVFGKFFILDGGGRRCYCNRRAILCQLRKSRLKRLWLGCVYDVPFCDIWARNHLPSKLHVVIVIVKWAFSKFSIPSCSHTHLSDDQVPGKKMDPLSPHKGEIPAQHLAKARAISCQGQGLDVWKRHSWAHIIFQSSFKRVPVLSLYSRVPRHLRLLLIQ